MARYLGVQPVLGPAQPHLGRTKRQRQLLGSVDDPAEMLGAVAVGLAPSVTVVATRAAATEVSVGRGPVEPAVPRVLDHLDGVCHCPAVLA